MATQRIFFEPQLNHVEWLDVTDGLVSATSHQNRGNHLIGLRVEGAIAEKQNLQLVTADGARHSALPSPIKQVRK